MGSFDSWSNGIVLSPEEINDQVFTRFEAGLPLTKVTVAHAFDFCRSDLSSQKPFLNNQAAEYTHAATFFGPLNRAYFDMTHLTKEAVPLQGTHECKFLVDGAWRLAPDWPTVTKENGETNNVLEVV